MTLAERATMATMIRSARASCRAQELAMMRDDGLLLKQAAFLLGVSERTARRYQNRMRRAA